MFWLCDRLGIADVDKFRESTSQPMIERWKAHWRLRNERNIGSDWAPLNRRPPTADELFAKLDKIGR